jgi:hypothetical protein
VCLTCPEAWEVACVENCEGCGRPVLQPGDLLTVDVIMREGEEDEYYVLLDLDGNLWHARPEWLTAIGPENG